MLPVLMLPTEGEPYGECNASSDRPAETEAANA
jgi:hypothetical protein